MLPRFLLLVVSLGLSTVALAGELKSEAEVRALGDRVMFALASRGITAAFAEMKPYVLVTEAEFESISLASKSQRDQFGTRYGKTVGFEFISSSKVGDSLVRTTYIEKTEKHAFPWTFYFYKTPTGWALNSFLWNDRYQQLFGD
jgi:hypothetical protein